MDMEKHAAACEHAFVGGFLDELEKVADARGLSDLEKLALIEQAGKLIGRGAKWLGGKLTQSGDDAMARAVKAQPKGKMSTEALDAGKTRRGWGEGLEGWGKQVQEGGDLARDVGGGALAGAGGMAGLGTLGLGGATLLRR